MKTYNLSIRPTRLKVSLLALLLLPWANILLAQNAPKEEPTKAAQLKQKIERNKEKLSKTRKQRKDALPKGRHNLKDKKTREEIVRQLKEAEEAHMEAVREQANLRGLELEGSMPNGGNFRLIDFDKKGTPIYEDSMNVDAAITTAADQVRDNPTYQNKVQIQVEAESYSSMNGIQLETTTDTGGGQNVGFIQDGSWCEYTINVPTTGQYRLNLRTASNNNNGGGIINLSIDGSSAGSVVVPDTNNWQSWTTILAYVNFTTTGNHTLRMDFSAGTPGDTGFLFNLNWFSYNRTVIIGHWESGTARVTHQELAGKISVWETSSTSTSDHATHVAGTLVSRGINPDTLGMAPDASIAAFSSGGATAEMMANGAAAPNTTGIHISNHSYGSTRGWRYDGDDNIWEWKGEYSPNGNQEDFYDESFGRYNGRAEEWDNITYNLPYYVMFVSAGNERGNVPNTGNSWRYNDNFSTVTVPSYDPSIHPLSNRLYKGNNLGYDTMEGGGLAKNSIAVGSSDEGIDGNGNRDPGFATAQSYSCRGPADDGRIKPDIHANGTGLTSSIASSDTATASYGGTSMSSPNVCGSAALLIDYYGTRFPAQAMRASTLKALILHTADDRGTNGPDYKYGWGIMNTKAAADVIKLHADGNGGACMLESAINDTTTTSETHSFGWDGNSPLRVTICWTDPASDEIDSHDSRTKTLVNDLNLKVTGPDGIHYPYVMPYVGDWSLAKIDDGATTGVNDVDNVEQVYLSAPAPGDYTVTVDYLGSLTDGIQNYSLIVTGQTAAEIEVEYDGPPVNGLADNSGVQDFGATAPSDASVVRSYTIRNTGGNPLTGLSITKSGTHQNDFTVDPLSSTHLSTGHTTTFTVSYDPLGTGARTAALQIASNDADENAFDINLAATGLSELEAWRLMNFSTTEGTGNFADNSDYDQDGALNLTEFSLATDPTKPDFDPTTFTSDETTTELTYTRNVNAMADYTFQVIWANELTQETWSSDSVTEEILSDDGSVQQVKATIPVGSSTKRFFQIQISPK